MKTYKGGNLKIKKARSNNLKGTGYFFDITGPLSKFWQWIVTDPEYEISYADLNGVMIKDHKLKLDWQYYRLPKNISLN